ncbi:hypothetical protein Rumeso_03016 [Rubellimicrobium mesophilum DSM 19309]|uniref:Peptidoglycan binding-like domain-containing protein n=1 Tax=Rubellimicrobium mesophilum DSM 19309 TaxID=442562 RepID=A0A017HM63_9RHOB|nr:hypothetical protein [Rubellimicrobium mesophilum]EYD75446.1 hypothetical protein Rumeso_03016 [Rubellimicrobium mesophilum DSM 19309]
MPRASASLLPVLAIALWPIQGHAQEGPSFDCRYAETATERAICASPRLSRLERRMYRSYLGLVEAVGERQARRLADRFLERRQACGADESCIAQRLRVSMRVFERRAAGTTRLAAREAGEDLASEQAAPQEQVAAAEPLLPEDIPSPVAREEAAPVEDALIPDDSAESAPRSDQAAPAQPTEPDLPLAAQAPLPSDLGPLLHEEAPTAAEEEVATAGTPPSADQLDAAIDGADLASSDAAASFDRPTAWAFMALPRDQRAEVQARLQGAGLLDGPAEGSWDRPTQVALDAFLASEEGQGFDAGTETGAALALEYLRSDAFAQAHGIAAAEAPAEQAAPDPNDPLASAEW